MPLPTLFEWAVWAHLDEIKNTELVLLKGHLLLELAVESAIGNLDKERAIKYKDLSFHKKLQILDVLQMDIESDLTKAIEHLQKINYLRNRLAHQFQFENGFDELGKWSDAVLVDFPGTKISKHTYRTKIVQAFASLAKVILNQTQATS